MIFIALIKCSECNKEISDKATTCIHCGKKVNVKNNLEKPIRKASKKGILIVGGVLLAIVLVGITIFLVLNHNSKSYVGKWEHNITWKRDGKVSKDKNSITLNEEPTYISYEQYQSILSNSENAIVVFVRESCHYCEEYNEILKEVNSNYTTPIYYYELEGDDILDISATPTTYIIKNGVNVETVEGKTEYNELSKILNKNNVD